MNYQSYPPCPKLAAFVESYWIMEQKETSLFDIYVHPTGKPQIILYMEQEKEADKILVCGQTIDCHNMTVGHKNTTIGITFHPHGLKAFIDPPLNELTGDAVDASLLDRSFTDLAERLYEFSDHLLMIKEIEKVLLSIMENKLIENYTISRYISDAINNTKGILSIDEIYNNIGFSKRHIERLFKAHVGISPRHLTSITRVNHAISLFQTPLSLTDIALETGFFDQSHFIRTFKTYTGFSPKQYRQL